MADISQIKLPDGTIYNLVDKTKLPLAGGTMTGQIVLASTGYRTYNAAGYSVDQHGNFTHLGTTTSDYWHLDSNNGTRKFSVYWETGDVTAAGNVTAPKFIGALQGTADYAASMAEANLTWGGKNFSGSYGCIDACLMDELGANRLQFIKASAITVEYSRDNGETWTDYGATDAQKQQIFAQGGALVIGKADSTHKATEHPGEYQLRITIDTSVANIYTYLNKFVVYVSTNNSGGCLCKIQKALQSTPTTFVDHTDWITVTGWSGYNILNTSYLVTYGNTASSQYGRVRFIFKDTESTGTSYNGLTVYQIKAFGGVGWNTPSTMAKTGHIYSYNENMDATFPNNITATKFIGALQGNADTATSASSASLATKANILNGFSNGGAGNITWGNQTGTGIWYNNDANGGSVGFRTNNPTSGQVSMVIDGTVYIKEGAQDVAAAVKSFSVSGQTVTYTNLWGGTGTFTTQDTKNTAGSTDTSSKIYLIGATSQAANPQTYSQDTAYVGTDGCLYSGGNKVLTSAPVTSVAGKTGAVTLTASDVGALASTTKYAGASTAGGSATSAAKLDTTTAGSATQPCYFASGVPSACTYSLNKTVPSDAVFTDTNNAVTQTATTTHASYEILFSGTADNTTRTEGVGKTDTLTYNPHTLIFTSKCGYNTSELHGTAIVQAYRNGTSFQECHVKINDIELESDSSTANTWDGTNTSLKDAIGAKVSKSGDTLTGALNFASGTWNNIGDDIKFGDIDWAGTVAFKGINGDTTVRLNEKDNDKKYIQLKLNSSEGNAYIQTSQKLRIKSDGDIEFFTDGSVTTYNKAGSGYKPMRASAFTVMSSKLVKSNIKDITKEKAEKILELRPVTFDMWHGENNQSGMIAEEVLEVLPELVIVPENYNEEEAKAKIENDELTDVPSLDYTKFVPYLIKIVQEQQKEIDELRERLTP